MDIVKFNGDRYALSKFSLFGFKYVYADIENVRHNCKIYWWDAHDTRNWYTTSTVEELEELIENYNPQIVKDKAKKLSRDIKEINKVEVIKKGVKFGCKNK